MLGRRRKSFPPRYASPPEPGRARRESQPLRTEDGGRLASASERGAGEHLREGSGLRAVDPTRPTVPERPERTEPRRGEQSAASRAAVQPRGPRPRPGCSPSHTPRLGPAGGERPTLDAGLQSGAPPRPPLIGYGSPTGLPRPEERSLPPHVPPPLAFPTQGVKGGDWAGKWRGVLPRLKEPRTTSATLPRDLEVG